MPEIPLPPSRPHVPSIKEVQLPSDHVGLVEIPMDDQHIFLNAGHTLPVFRAGLINTRDLYEVVIKRQDATTGRERVANIDIYWLINTRQLQNPHSQQILLTNILEQLRQTPIRDQQLRLADFEQKQVTSAQQQEIKDRAIERSKRMIRTATVQTRAVQNFFAAATEKNITWTSDAIIYYDTIQAILADNLRALEEKP